MIEKTLLRNFGSCVTCYTYILIAAAFPDIILGGLHVSHNNTCCIVYTLIFQKYKEGGKENREYPCKEVVAWLGVKSHHDDYLTTDTSEQMTNVKKSGIRICPSEAKYSSHATLIKKMTMH